MAYRFEDEAILCQLVGIGKIAKICGVHEVGFVVFGDPDAKAWQHRVKD